MPVADVAQLSRSIYKALQSVCRQSVLENVQAARLAHAAEHLAANKRRIKAAAQILAFENHETFTEGFRDANGVTPEEYRAGPASCRISSSPPLPWESSDDENVPLAADCIVLEVRRTVQAAPRSFAGFPSKSD